jgi:hypothetical protein
MPLRNLAGLSRRLARMFPALVGSILIADG